MTAWFEPKWGDLDDCAYEWSTVATCGLTPTGRHLCVIERSHLFICLCQCGAIPEPLPRPRTRHQRRAERDARSPYDPSEVQE